MLLALPMRFPSRRLRPVLAAGCTATLALSLAACGATERLTTAMQVRDAVTKLGAQPTASVIASVDGSRAQARRFLEQTRGSEPSPRAVRLLTGTEVTLSAGSGDDDTPLREMQRSDAMDVASTVNFGGADAFAVKSVQDELFLRVSAPALAKGLGASAGDRRKAARAPALARDLPLSLGSARDALRGKWFEVDPQAFDDFARAAEQLADRGDRAGRDPASGAIDESGKGRALKDAVEIASAVNGRTQREFVNRIETLLTRHAEFEDTGHRDGARHVRVSLPGREAAEDLSAALKPLRLDVAPSRMPDRDITADLAIRRGQLTEMTVDLGQFTHACGERPGAGGDCPRLPLKLDFGSGAAVSVARPDEAKELRPEDLMAAIVYGALGRGDF